MPELLVNSPPPITATRMYAVVVSIGVLCSLAIVVTHELTQPIIQRKQNDFKNHAILEVLPGATHSVAFHWTSTAGFEESSHSATQESVVFAGYDGDGRLVGFAIETQGMGYQDVVRILYGYARDRQAVIGLRVLQSRETPGLGDRIETDDQFRKNFTALDVALNRTGDALAHPIEFVKPGSKHSAWQIDGMSGATISSRAVASMLHDSTNQWIPRLRTFPVDVPVLEEKEVSYE